MIDNNSSTLRLYIYFFWSAGCVLYSKIFNVIEYEIYHIPGFMWANLIDLFIKYWYIGFVIPVFCLILGLVLRAKKFVLVEYLPDLLLFYGIMWLMLTSLIWELHNIKYHNLRTE